MTTKALPIYFGRIVVRQTRGRVDRAVTRALKAYADWRVGATDLEKHAYKTTDSVLLTFDDYGTPEQIAQLLAILKRERVRAMFFPQGNWASQYPELVEKVRQAGHVIGNHTYSHPDLLALPVNQIQNEIKSGVKSPWFRPPRGRYNSKIRAIAHAQNLRICHWTIDSDDWRGTEADQITAKILRHLHPGAVVLMHPHAPHTLEALPQLIKAIRAAGFELTSRHEPDWD